MGNKLFVGNLSFTVTEATLSNLFAEAGTVQSCKIIIDRDTGKSKGFCFIEMSSNEEATAAISKFNGYELEGRALTVNEARPQAPREGGSNRGGGSRPGGFRENRGNSGGYGGGGSRY